MTPAVENPPAEEEANAEGKKNTPSLKIGLFKISTLLLTFMEKFWPETLNS